MSLSINQPNIETSSHKEEKPIFPTFPDIQPAQPFVEIFPTLITMSLTE